MPTTTGFATDLITFSRGSLATVTDSNGYIKWAPHNLLLASEQLDTSSWTKTSATIAANSIAAPNNAITADTIVASGANGTVLQSYTAVAVPYVFGVWLRRKTGTGNIQISADNGTYTTVTITNDWALYTVTQTPTAGTKSAGIRIVTSGDEVYAWGAHLYRSDLGGMQANASAYPYYNPSTPKNLLGFTELLTTGWTNTNTTDTQVAIAAPNGSANSIDVAATAGNGTLLASLSLLASPYTFSIWLRRKTGTGTVEITVDGTTYVTAAVTADWQRFSTTLTPTAGTRTPGIRIVTSGDAVYAWGAQLSDSASLDPYAPNFGAAPSAAAAHGPRLDYDPSTLAAKGLLVEEQRTNLFLQSTFSSSWLTTGGAVLTPNNIVAPDGSITGAKIDLSTTVNSAIYQVVATAGTFTQSVWLRGAVGGETVQLSFFTPSPPASGASAVFTLTTSWQRYTFTTTCSANTFWYIISNNTTAKTIYAWGAQLEAGSFATSYIPTTSASATRSADVASVSTQAFPYSASEGTWVASYKTLALGEFTRVIGTASDANDSTPIFVYQSEVGTWNGSSQLNTASGLDPAANIVKAAFAHSGSGRSLVYNAGTVASDANTMPSSTGFYLGRGISTNYLNGHIRQITYIPRRLTNAELISRTA